ncbi:crossveinless d [Carabus blaptoides fortunei]
MNTNAALLLVAISVLVRTDAFTRFVPVGKEITYDYHASVKLGTYEPAEFASLFILDGKLHMQDDGKSALMRFSDLTFKLYNGEINGENEKESLPLQLPEEAKTLLKPFRVVYNDDGKIKHLTIDSHDTKFARNVKKAVASILQLDMKEIKLDSKTPHAFETVETDIYGEGLVHYNIMPEENEITVQKMIDVLNSTHWYTYVGVMDEERFSMDKLPLSVDSQRKYTFSKDDHGWQLKRIETHGGISMNIMKGMSVSQQMSTIQRMQLLETIPIQTKISMGEEITEDLVFKLDPKPDTESLRDLSFGRSGMTMEQYQKIVLNILDDLVNYLDENQMTMENPNAKQGQAVNRLHNVMGQLDLATLEHIFASLEEKTDEHDKKKFIAFQEMIPLIGTRASTMLIRNVIRKQKVSEDMAISMLQKMPFYLRMRSDKLLTEVEDLMNLENASEHVRKVALLSFASLVSKVHAHDFHNHDAKNIELVDKYVLKIMNLLKSTEDYSLQYLYMNALHNIKFVSKHLEPYVKGEATQNHHVRFMAMCAAFAEIIEDEDRVFDIYWPILTDHSLHLELRVAAYVTIMAAKPSQGRLRDIYWLLRSEPCPDMYHLFYTHLTGTAHTTNPNVPEEMKVWAAQVLNTIHKPFRHPITSYYNMDYIDPKYGFGAITNAWFAATNSSKSMFIDFSTEFYGMTNTFKGLWLKIDGVDETIVNKSPKQHVNDDIQFLLRMLSTLKDQKDIHIEYGLLNHDKVIEINFFDHKNIDKLIDELVSLMENITKKSLHISYDMVTEIVLPNDLGFSTMVQYRIPRIRNNEISITDEKTDDMYMKHVNMKLQTVQHSALEMVTYNPVAGFWQGIHRLQMYDMVMPLDIKLAMSRTHHDIKITINRHNDLKKETMGIRTMSRTSVSATLGDKHNLLQQSSKTSEPFAEVTRGLKYKKTKIFFEHDCIHTGMKYQLAAFNSELPLSRRSVMALLDSVSQRSFKNARTAPGRFLLSVRNLLARLILVPRPESFGLIIKGEPSTVHPVDKIELSLRLLKSSHQLNQKMSTHASLSTKTKEDKIINKWDFDLVTEEDFAFDHRIFNLQYTRMQHDKENFRMCVDGKKEWKNKELIGQIKMTMGHTADDKTCVDTEGTVEIGIIGKQSDEQLKLIADHLTYKECLASHVYEPMMKNIRIPQHESVECIKKQTSIRHYDFDIKMNNVPRDRIMAMHVWIGYIKAMTLPYYSVEKTDKISEDKSARNIIVEYPILGKEININVLKDETTVKLIEAPTKYLQMFGFYPDSYHFSKKFMKHYHWGSTESCIIDEHELLNVENIKTEIHNGDWLQITHNNPAVISDHTLAIFIKKFEGPKHMGLKMVLDDQKLEIQPAGEEIHITLNEKPLELAKGGYHKEAMFGIGKLHDEHQTTILHVFKTGLYIAFDGEHVMLEKPKLFKSVIGMCFE